MKKYRFSIVLSLALLLFFMDGSTFAQENSTRFLKQHKSRFLKDHLKQTEDMLLNSIQSNSVNMSTSAVQTVRELEEIFPSEPFSSFIEPLGNNIQNEKADTQLRILSALALDKLHSDKGDKIIYKVSQNTNNESVKNLCTALAIESIKQNLISSK